MASKLYDVIIIGGGPGGLSMATMLARQAYATLVFDSHQYRNERSKHLHTIAGLDHMDPAEFRAKARSDLETRYPMVEFKDARVSKVKKAEDGTFEAEVEGGGGVFRAKKLGLATGVKEVFEGLPAGYQDCWARGIFHCMYCHGYEDRGVQSIGVIATGAIKVASILTHMIPMVARFAEKNVTIYTHGNDALHAEISTSFKSPKITTDNRPIASLALEDASKGPAVQITFEDGTTKTEGFCVGQPEMVQRSPFAEQLGLEMDTNGVDVKTNAPLFETSVQGCFSAGDSSTMMKATMQAMYMGQMGGAGMAFQLGAAAEAAGQL